MKSSNWLRFPLLMAILWLASVLVGCDSDVSALATLTPTVQSIPPSATVAPVAPTANNLDSSNVGVDAFTRAAPPVVGGSNGGTVTPTPAPTEASLAMSFITADGLSITGTYYAGPTRPAPVILLLHMNGSNKEAWRLFATTLQTAGYSVLAIDLRGHGETGGKADWNKVPGDVVEVLNQLRNLPGIDPARISVIGADIGANLAIRGCADWQGCKSVVMISPALNYLGIGALDPLSRYGTGPVLIVASRDDKPSGSDSVTLDKAAKGSHTLQLYPGTTHGTNLFGAQPDLATVIIQWLASP
jgi:pimeloyl-ACP methyl ester carboxylesterase